VRARAALGAPGREPVRQVDTGVLLQHLPGDGIIAPAFPSNNGCGAGVLYPLGSLARRSRGATPENASRGGWAGYLMFSGMVSLSFRRRCGSRPWRQPLGAENGPQLPAVTMNFGSWLMPRPYRRWPQGAAAVDPSEDHVAEVLRRPTAAARRARAGGARTLSRDERIVAATFIAWWRFGPRPASSASTRRAIALLGLGIPAWARLLTLATSPRKATCSPRSCWFARAVHAQRPAERDGLHGLPWQPARGRARGFGRVPSTSFRRNIRVVALSVREPDGARARLVRGLP